MSRYRVLSVGQCGFDHGQLARYFDQTFEADLVPISSQSTAIQTLRDSGGFDLVLVNRVGDRDGAPGLRLIQALKSDPALAQIPILLVSNHASAQSEATALGALPGFGKAELGTPETNQKIQAALGADESDHEDRSRERRV